jgi:predicted DNA-binding protein
MNMASRKVTFTLDAATILRLEQAAERSKKPKSEVVREAIRDYHERVGRVSEHERLRLLKAFDELVPAIPQRSASAVRNELQQVRLARRAGGRRRS